MDNTREWLRENGYEDVLTRIQELEARWKAEGKKTRRNWWEVLAGSKTGQPRTIGGHEFPVLRSARVREGLPITPNAIQRDPNEKAPPVRTTGRWPSTAKKLTRSGRRRRRSKQ